jgi:hypothetical protein
MAPMPRQPGQYAASGRRAINGFSTFQQRPSHRGENVRIAVITLAEVLAIRMRNLLLAASEERSPADIVAWMGAMQSSTHHRCQRTGHRHLETDREDPTRRGAADFLQLDVKVL